MEVIDSTALHLTEAFAEDNPGARDYPDGSVPVTMVATRYGFHPQLVEIRAKVPVTFRFATPDVLHGLHIPTTNVDTMVPGYVSEVSTALRSTGTFPIYCDEYCGLGHHSMWSRVTLVPKQG